MGVFDKLKNVFFEEEYVEVEEPIKSQRKKSKQLLKRLIYLKCQKFMKINQKEKKK
ncbi:MAG: hypothetical protein ACI31R_02370 [Bacilli bacterium]